MGVYVMSIVGVAFTVVGTLLTGTVSLIKTINKQK